MKPAERLQQITLKVERAKKHVFDLQSEINTFFQTNPYKFAAKRDPKTRRLVYYVASVEPTPSNLPLIAADILGNLIATFDHLAYQIVCSDTRDNPPKPHRIYFPIADSPAKYEADKGRKIEGAVLKSINAIDAIKPYKGGNDLLWSLQHLNNIAKHRKLLTVGSFAAGVNFNQLFATIIGKTTLPPDCPIEDFVALIKSTNFVMPQHNGFPLKPGFQLFADLPDAEFNPDMQFRFDVAISEPQVIEAQSILETLHQLTNLVEGIVTALTPRLG